ncbi:hypothetical protein BGW37DRAFT_516368 [Umbelopsis sp. PMI_123]|nr:hypothetical protein BGW37DRAFT_516368 [Umbelopsis sp. PMI_123]
MRVDSVALDVDGFGQRHRMSGDDIHRQYSYASTAPTAPEDSRRRSQHPRRSTVMSTNSNKDDKNKFRTKGKSSMRFSSIQYWIPSWRQFSTKDAFGVLLAVIGIILTGLCLTGATSYSVRNIYFAKVYSKLGDVGEARFGLRGYCTSTSSTNLQCSPSTEFVYVPWDVVTSGFLNTTYPKWFTDAITPDQNLDPLATPSPPHDISITAAMGITVACASIGILCQIARYIRAFNYRDSNYTRGFLMAFATVTCLLAMALTLLMYVNGCQELENEYPHIQTRKGPCLAMIGTAFGCILCATILFFDKFLDQDSTELY